MANDVEAAVDIKSMLTQIVDSFTTAAAGLEETMSGAEWQTRDYMYRMPQMRLSIQVELSYSDKKLKGVFRKRSREAGSALQSRIDIDVVAVPRSAPGG